MTEPWLIDGAPDQIIAGDVTSAGFRFHLTARTHRQGGGVGIRDFLKFQNHFRFSGLDFL